MTRAEERRQRREARAARERAVIASAARRRRIRAAAAGLAMVAVIAVIGAVALSGNGTGLGVGVAATASPASAADAGVMSLPAPWPPEYGSLLTRLEALNLPSQSDSAYHIHAMLRVYVAGARVPVPAGIGIDPIGQFISPIHTHDTSGIIHMEASRPYPFTLGQFFAIWGVTFTRTQLGGYHTAGTNVLTAYANGSALRNPPGYVMRAHDAIVVAFGRRGSFPTAYAPNFPPGE